MRKAFIHCNIYKKEEDAFLIEDGKFVKFGASEEIQKELEDTDELVDVHGLSVYPGFMDTHLHLLRTGDYVNHVQLLGVTDKETVRKKVEPFLSSEDMWITGRGYACDFDKAFLDSISTEKAICLTRVDGHSMIVNSKALELADVHCDTEIEGGHIEYDTGIVYENAINILKNAQPAISEEQIEKDLLQGMQYCASFGITSMGTDDFVSLTKDYTSVLNVYEKLRYQQRMPIRVVQQCEFENVKDFAKFLDEGYCTGMGDDFFSIGPLKLIGDGSLGSKNAAMIHGYLNEPDKHGTLVHTDEEMELYVEMANKFNMPTIVHVIGDQAVEQVLNVFEKTLYEGNPLRSGLVHCQIMNARQIERIQKLNLCCYIQSAFIEDDAQMVKECIPRPLAASSYAFKTLLETVPTGNGSDSPVCVPNVLRGIQLAMTRCDSHGNVLNADQAMTLDQAIESYTSKAAYTLNLETKTGTLAEGYYADFVVLDKDLSKEKVEDIDKVKVMMTVVNGETVFER